MGTELAIILVLLIAALVMFILEIVTPTFGVLIAIGLAALAGAVFVAFTINQTFGLIMLVVTIVLIPTYLVMVVRLLPSSPLGKKLFLKAAEWKDKPGEGTPTAAEESTLIDREGVAETYLRPVGAIRIDGKRYTATAESTMIGKGARVKVIRYSGLNLVVREVTDEDES
ncbi:MAG: NfeD family protein [Phycisphaerae bacterium]